MTKRQRSASSAALDNMIHRAADGSASLSSARAIQRSITTSSLRAKAQVDAYIRASIRVPTVLRCAVTCSASQASQSTNDGSGANSSVKEGSAAIHVLFSCSSQEFGAPKDLRVSDNLSKVMVTIKGADGESQEACWVHNDAVCDAISVRRVARLPVSVNVTVVGHNQSEVLTLTEPLRSWCGVSSGTHADIMSAIWRAAAMNGLLQPQDRSIIRCDDKLKSLFRCDSVALQALPGLVSQFLQPYHHEAIDLSINSLEQTASKAFDLVVSKVPAALVAAAEDWEKEKADTTSSADDEKLRNCLQEIEFRSRRMHFMKHLSANPLEFLKSVVASQKNDQAVLRRGGGPVGIQEEELRRAAVWWQPWVEDAVAHFVHRQASAQQL